MRLKATNVRGDFSRRQVTPLWLLLKSPQEDCPNVTRNFKARPLQPGRLSLSNLAEQFERAEAGRTKRQSPEKEFIGNDSNGEDVTASVKIAGQTGCLLGTHVRDCSGHDTGDSCTINQLVNSNSARDPEVEYPDSPG
jgi:hypothetical protein